MYQQYNSDPMEGVATSPSRHCGACRKRINYILGIGIVLALIGASLSVAFGLLYVRPYVYMRHLESALCSTQGAGLTGDIVSCTCASDGSGSCMSQYPCLRISVNYTADLDVFIVNATLYDSYETYTIQSTAQQCSYHKCDRVSRNNIIAVTGFANAYGNQGTSYRCFVDPNDASYAVVDVVTVATVVHCLFWPLLSLVIGLAIVLIYVFHFDSSGSSVGDNDDNTHSLPSSLERRLVRVGDCTMILSGEEKLAQ